MSRWTHIVSAIEVETCINGKDIKKVIETMLVNAPEITGSEGSADIFVNIPSGYNVSVYSDCNSCRYKDSITEDEDGFFCDAEDDFKCPRGDYQTRATITIVGDLRDRIKGQTTKEYKGFIRFLEKECDFMILNKSVKISEG